MIRFVLTIFLVSGQCSYPLQTFTRAEINEDIELSTAQLIRKNGYPIEVYPNIITEDNYVLEINRIPHGKVSDNRKSREPVLLMHGLMGTSLDFVLLGPQRGLAYLLADRGYDVWLGNSRGATYSRRHLTLYPQTDARFWDFSWHEIGLYDLPAIFTLMKNVTKKERFSYIGSSEGTTIFYVLVSKRPEYNQNVTVMISLAPIAYMAHYHSPIIRPLAALEPIWKSLSTLLNINEIPPPSLAQLFNLIYRIFCTQEGFTQNICVEVLYRAVGYYPTQEHKALTAAILGRATSASVRELLHYSQSINSGFFKEYDFGKIGNLRKYGSAYPPSYNLSRITTPVALFYAETDWFSRPQDVRKLCKELSNCVYKYKIPSPRFSHFDFFVATDVVELVYRNVFDILKKYNKISL